MEIGSNDWMEANVAHLDTNGNWVAMVAEEDGSPSKAPTRPEDVDIEAGGRCPDALHDSWLLQEPTH